MIIVLTRVNKLSRARHDFQEGLLWVAPNFLGQLKVQSFSLLNLFFFILADYDKEGYDGYGGFIPKYCLQMYRASLRSHFLMDRSYLLP
jgi:hypothetical protein